MKRKKALHNKRVQFAINLSSFSKKIVFVRCNFVRGQMSFWGHFFDPTSTPLPTSIVSYFPVYAYFLDPLLICFADFFNFQTTFSYFLSVQPTFSTFFNKQSKPTKANLQCHSSETGLKVGSVFLSCYFLQHKKKLQRENA